MPFCFGWLATLPVWISDYWIWWIAGVIVVGGLLGFGLRDLARFRFRRAWAISDVCFAESVRRRVLWVTPLAIVGVLAVSVLQHPTDLQDAIRQTIKLCLFASGALVTITAVILACTNLPREIDNRVIFTVVTKPTTRLEIVLGKVLGFVRISGLIVLIMGLFSFGFLEWQNWRLSAQLAERLRIETDPSTRHTLQGYADAGLLSTKSLDEPVDFQVHEHFPPGAKGEWITGDKGYFYIVPFALGAEDRKRLDAATEDPPRAQLLVISTIRLHRNVPTTQDLRSIQDRKLDMEPTVLGPALPGQDKSPLPIPQISVQILDGQKNVLVPASEINGGKPVSVPVNRPPNGDGTYTVAAAVPADAVRRILDAPMLYVSVTPETPSVEYEISRQPTVLDVIDASAEHVIKPAPDPAHGLAHADPIFLSGTGRYGMRVVGGRNGTGSVGVFRFENVRLPKDLSGTADFRFFGGVERGGDFDASQPWSIVTFAIHNRRTGQTSPLIEFHPETNRDFPLAVPARFLEGGNFDVYIRGMDNGQWVGMSRSSVQFISAEHSFVVNLLKSLLILWLFSVLVVVIAVFTSTFLSWPIAVVLTLLLLLGHWGVEQMGDALSPGVGRSVATDFGFRDAAQMKVVSASVDALAKMLRVISIALPDLGKFPVMDDITRGVSIPPGAILDSLGVLGCYALPMLILSFVILKNKEVAP